MHKAKHIFVMLLMLAFAANGTMTQAQRRTVRTSEAQTQNIISRIETNADAFRESLDQSLDQSRLDGTRAEDEINQYVRDFEGATDRLRDNFNNRRAVSADVQEVFNRSIVIDDFLVRNRLTPRAQRDWALIRTDLNRLGRVYNVAYRRTGSPFPNGSSVGSTTADARLTGTYRLDVNRSDDPRAAADRVTRALPVNQRRRNYDALLTRLESPQEISLERRSNSITIASSRAPQVTIEATGREEIERYPNGRSSRVRANFTGDILTVTSNNDRDRASDFTVRFEPLANGNQLRVTRTVYADRLQQPVTVRSLYTRTSSVAQFGIYQPDNFPRTGSTTNTGVSGGFIVPNGTSLVAVLNNNISTDTTPEGERFTMTVRDPGEFDGATVEGYISNVSRSGRVSGRSGLTLNFERITLRNGQTYQFAGAVESIRTSGGEDVRVDNEGTVQDENSQTGRTVQRAAIGTAVGALIGAIAGGGKGAAIGAVVGAGAGAGSVYVQGREDLNLSNGTEVTIRASAPR